MSEYDHPTHQPEQPPHENELQFGAYPAPDRDMPNWRRLEVASHRLGELIAAGISTAMNEHREIDDGTARLIAHVLGRAFGRQSALAGFGQTGEGDYEALRDEYLTIYGSAEAPASTKQLIDWLGTYLVRREDDGTLRHAGEDDLPPKLEQLFVPTDVHVGEEYFTVHVPASYDRTAIEGLTATLHELQLDKDAALQAFLSLPDVNAMSGDIMEDFHENYAGIYLNIEDALDELAEMGERERDVSQYAAQRQLIIEDMTPDYEALREHASDVFDLVEWKGRVYVFYK